MNKQAGPSADICLILEGTYPYVTGGVSTWTHELLKAQRDRSFHIVSILPRDAQPKVRYEIPNNVLSIQNIHLQTMPKGVSRLPKKQLQQLFTSLEVPLLNLQSGARLKDLQKIIKGIHATDKKLGGKLLLDSEESWIMLLRMYNAAMGEQAFLDYFWSWRALQGGLYTILLADLPEAACYHSFCTGYAGLMLARAKLETGKPCILTEHGIYTNERRIEIGSADWLDDQRALNYNIQRHALLERTLRDFWIDTFGGYSKVCYEACDQIITLYEGNKEMEVADGADAEKIRIIPNGINYDYYSKIPRDIKHPPTIALIGRVVPIKDVKTFIRACGVLQQTMPDFRAYIIGPTDEDKDYYHECTDIINQLKLQQVITFTGKVQIAKYLPRIDVVVLSSVSEAQPLVILEAGAAGIPSVATDVGGCREMIMGSSWETPKLGAGGGIASLSNPQSIASEIQRLLMDKTYYSQCSMALKERVRKYYNEIDQHKAYEELYHDCIEMGKRLRKIS